jgi:F-type H+-transporting ATPase subunit delta
MAELATIARPYAEAAFALARENKALSVWAEALSMLAAIVTDDKISAAVDNPKLSNAQKHSLFASIMGDKLPAQASNFVNVLLGADRVKLLPQISEHFQALKRNAENVAKATVVSAFSLTDAQRADIKAGLAKRYGREIELAESTDASLIGGAKIIVGDQVIDRTVVGQLAKMERQIKA